MSNEEINKTIAEHFGWRLRHVVIQGCEDGYWVPPLAPESEGDKSDDAFIYSNCHPPDYCKDVNVWIQIQGEMRSDVENAYSTQVRRISNREGKDGSDLYSRLVGASALIRVKAFLDVIGGLREAK